MGWCRVILIFTQLMSIMITDNKLYVGYSKYDFENMYSIKLLNSNVTISHELLIFWQVYMCTHYTRLPLRKQQYQPHEKISLRLELSNYNSEVGIMLLTIDRQTARLPKCCLVKWATKPSPNTETSI